VAGLFKMFEDVGTESPINPRIAIPALMRIKPRAAFRPRVLLIPADAGQVKPLSALPRSHLRRPDFSRRSPHNGATAGAGGRHFRHMTVKSR
jgi:hypothetical protein